MNKNVLPFILFFCFFECTNRKETIYAYSIFSYNDLNSRYFVNFNFHIIMADIIRSTLDWVIPDDIKGLEIAREYRTTR